MFVHDNVLGWRLVENCTVVQEERRGREYAVTMHTNNHGFRDNKDYRYAKRAQVKRVVLIGDSFSFGNGVEEPGRASNLLEMLLGGAIEVYNLAISNYGLDQAFLMLRERGFAYQPDLVLVGFSDAMFERLLRGVTASGWSKPFFKIVDGQLQLNLQPDKAILAPKSLLEHSYLWDLIKIRRLGAAAESGRSRRHRRGAHGEDPCRDCSSIEISRSSTRCLLDQLEVHPGQAQRRTTGVESADRQISKTLRFPFPRSLFVISSRRLQHVFFIRSTATTMSKATCTWPRSFVPDCVPWVMVVTGDNPPCRLDRAKIYANIDILRRCDFDGSGNGLALGGKCLPLQCAPLDSSAVCPIPNGQTGRRRCEEFRGWGARWSQCGV